MKITGTVGFGMRFVKLGYASSLSQVRFDCRFPTLFLWENSLIFLFCNDELKVIKFLSFKLWML